MQRAMVRASAVLLLIAGSTMACSRHADEPAQLWTRTLNGRNGVVAVFDPANCALAGELVEMLNRVAREPGMLVRLYVVGVDSSAQSRSRIAELFQYGGRVQNVEDLPVAERADVGRAALVVVVREGDVVLAARGETANHAAAWLPAALGMVTPEGRPTDEP